MSRESARHLIHWLRSLGGYVDERIVVTASTNSVRGLVATSAIHETTKPLVALPEALVLTPAAALYSLEASGLLSASQADALADYAVAAKDPVAPIALLLAADARRIERMKEQKKEAATTATTPSSSSSSSSPSSPSSLPGKDWPMSPWGAYTASLPPPPPPTTDGEEEGSGDGGCAGWFLGPKAREAALSSSSSPFSTAAQRKRVRRLLDDAISYEKAAVERAQALLIARGSDLVRSGAASARTLLWARSQVCSRAFAAPSSKDSRTSSSSEEKDDIVPALLPVIDLCNHSPRGGFPAWGTVAANETSSSSSSSSSSDGGGNSAAPPPPPPPPARLCWLRNREPLAEGGELTTDYSRLCGGDAAAWMVNYGFVPEEVK